MTRPAARGVFYSEPDDLAQREPPSRGPHELTPSTLTHARLRAAQGDVRAARAILRAILRREPGHAAAVAALKKLGGRRDRSRSNTRAEAPGPRRPASVALLANTLREALGPESERSCRAQVARLRNLLGKIERGWSRTDGPSAC